MYLMTLLSPAVSLLDYGLYLMMFINFLNCHTRKALNRLKLNIPARYSRLPGVMLC